MCYCEKPNINGEFGYKWQPADAPSICQPDAPDVAIDETILYDEPGRCGGIDSHAHHYRLTHWPGGRYYLRVKHGGGEDAVPMSLYGNGLKEMIAGLDSNARYWLFHQIYRIHQESEERGADLESWRWKRAVAEKRIKARKQRGSSKVKVWIESAIS